jgi:hypothetical protein
MSDRYHGLSFLLKCNSIMLNRHFGHLKKYSSPDLHLDIEYLMSTVVRVLKRDFWQILLHNLFSVKNYLRLLVVDYTNILDLNTKLNSSIKKRRKLKRVGVHILKIHSHTLLYRSVKR